MRYETNDRRLGVNRSGEQAQEHIGVRMPLAVSRRRFFILSAGVAGATILSACGGDDDDDTAATEEATTEAETTQQTGGGDETTPEATATEATTESEATPEATGTESSGTTGGTKIFRTGTLEDVQNMDPAHITGAPDYSMGEAIFNFIGRYTYDPPLGTEIIPELASDWEVSDDAMQYTFNLREGVQFHKGYGELTAESVKWNWDRIQNPDTGSRYAPDFEGATIEATDNYTVTVSFPYAYPAFIRASLAFRPGLIISPEAFEERGEAWKTDPVGTGPFVWESYEAGTNAQFVRNEEYWGDPAKVDEIFWRVSIDDRSAVLAVATGELDLFYIDNPDVALDTQENTDPNTVFMPAEFGTAPYWIAFHMEKPPLDDLRVRQALRYAIDEEAIANELFGGLATPIESFLPPFMFGYSEDVMQYDYDPDRARQLLEEASDVIPSGWAPEMIGNADSVIAQIIHEVVGSYWNDVGVNVQVQMPEYGVFLERRYDGNYDMFGIGVGRIEPDQIATPYWIGGARANQSHYSGADDLITAAKTEPNEEQRAELYRQLQDKISSDAAAAFIVATSAQLLVNQRVSGIAGAGWQARIDWFNVDVPPE